MMKRLWIYPLIFSLMIAAIFCCILRIGWLLHSAKENSLHPGAQLVMEVHHYAQI